LKSIILVHKKSFKFDEMMKTSLSIAPRDKADILARALSFIRKFYGKTLTIQYGGNAMTDPALALGMA
jgi:acetylglutamate kinase